MNIYAMTLDQLIVELNTLNACVSGCNGRCTICPSEAAREAVTRLDAMRKTLQDYAKSEIYGAAAREVLALTKA